MVNSIGVFTADTCPACKKSQLHVSGRFGFRDFDASLFNMNADFASCAHCGFVRVLVPFSDADICEHYKNDSLYSSLSGVGVGGLTPQDVARYEQYADILKDILKQSESIADIGCASGGLLKYLRDHMSFAGTLTGVDVDTRCLSSLSDSGIRAVEGSALNLALPENSVDLIFYTHVYEHILELDGVVEQMKRVLTSDGYAFIEVPDGPHYSQARVHDFFWLGTKEHVNHFSPDALGCLLNRHGMAIHAVHRTQFPMKGGAFYPSLIVVARATKGSAASFVPAQNELDWFQQHMRWELAFAAKTRNNIHAFLSGKPDAAIWGIGFEFFNLISTDALKITADTILFDSNVAKQALTIEGCRIRPPCDIGRQMPLLCTSQMSWQPILEQALRLGFERDSIFCI